MNKTTNSIKELKEQTVLKISPPNECRVCGYDVKQMEEEFEVAWLMYQLPNSGFVFYVCPNCNVCSGNVHSVENFKKIREQGPPPEPPRVMQPQKSIILPGRN